MIIISHIISYSIIFYRYHYKYHWNSIFYHNDYYHPDSTCIYIYIIWVFCWGVSSIDPGLVVYTSYPILMGSWYPSSSGFPQNIIGLPSGKFTVCYFQMAIEVDLPIKDGVFSISTHGNVYLHHIFHHGWETHRLRLRWGKSPETREKIPGRLARASDLHWCSVGGFRCP